MEVNGMLRHSVNFLHTCRKAVAPYLYSLYIIGSSYIAFCNIALICLREVKS